MTVVMAGVIVQFADRPAIAFTVVMLAGMFQIFFGVIRIGRYINLVPFPVISGFMSGIGVIIILLQLGPLVGHATPKGSVPVVISALPAAFAHPVLDAVLIGFGSLAIVYLWPGRLQRIVPAPLVALVVGTLAALLLPGAPILGDIPSGLPTPHLPVIDLTMISEIVGAALVLALLGAIDSLLTSLIADNITRTYHNSDRELIGQGIGNAIAGLFGAIPGAGATMRTVVNVRAGGRTPISGALHALVLVAVVLGLGAYARYIPHAVLAGILLRVGFDIIDWGYLRRAHRAPAKGVIFMAIVLALTVFVDLITAVAVGIVLASLLFVKHMADLQMENIARITMGEGHHQLSVPEQAALARGHGRVVCYDLAGPFSFGSAKELARRMAIADEYDVLVLDLEDVSYLDSSAGLAVEDVVLQATSHGRQVFIVGLRPRVRTVLDRLGVTRLIPAERVLDSRLAALEAAAMLIEAHDAHAVARTASQAG
jgi:SulP family sulfate permease